MSEPKPAPPLAHFCPAPPDRMPREHTPAPRIVYLNQLSVAARAAVTHWLQWLYGDPRRALDRHKVYQSILRCLGFRALSDTEEATKAIEQGALISPDGLAVFAANDKGAPWAKQ